jgi:hypothetical protein
MILSRPSPEHQLYALRRVAAMIEDFSGPPVPRDLIRLCPNGSTQSPESWEHPGRGVRLSEAGIMILSFATELQIAQFDKENP